MTPDKPFNAKVAAWELLAALAENPEETGVSHICRLGPLADMIQAALEEAYAEGARKALDNGGFAEGAVLAAERIARRVGVFEFGELLWAADASRETTGRSA